MKIGELRRSLFMDWNCRWNGIVRDVTAKHELADEEVPVFPVYEDLFSTIKSEARLDHSFPWQEGSRVQQLFAESQ